jgi:hypothetical protein
VLFDLRLDGRGASAAPSNLGRAVAPNIPAVFLKKRRRECPESDLGIVGLGVMGESLRLKLITVPSTIGSDQAYRISLVTLSVTGFFKDSTKGLKMKIIQISKPSG